MNQIKHRLHKYAATVQWKGNMGSGTSSYDGYSRNHLISVEGKPDIAGSSDPSFRGDASKYNPEELLVASLSTCHMLWYLHLCAVSGVVVTDYSDYAAGVMMEDENSRGRFTEVLLSPVVHVAEQTMAAAALALHAEAGKYCFIANSMNFPVRYQPSVLVG